MSGNGLDYLIEPLQLEVVRKNPRNARVHSSRQIAKLEGSIKAFGFLVPIIVDEDNLLLCGHARVEASARIGHTTVPAIRICHLSEAQKRAFVIADNRLVELASWDEQILKEEFSFLDEVAVDFDLSVIGFETAEIDILLDSPDPASRKDDRLPETPLGAPPITANGLAVPLEARTDRAGFTRSLVGSDSDAALLRPLSMAT